MRTNALTFLIIAYLGAVAQRLDGQQKQNPSPTVDTTRQHGRIAEQQVPGRRIQLSVGTLWMPSRRPAFLYCHFHGPGWIAEVAATKAFAHPPAVLTVQLGVSSDPYTQAFGAPGKFQALVAEAEKAAGVRFSRIVLSSFSAGYGAVREILRDPVTRKPVEAVLFADSMHADYGNEDRDLDAFIEFARDAVAGRKQMLVTHSEVFPGTYVSSTEAADHILKRLKLHRRPVLKWGPGGMQQLSEVRSGGLTVLGFAGNSAPDHADHLFGIVDWARLFQRAGAKRTPPKVAPAKMNR